MTSLHKEIKEIVLQGGDEDALAEHFASAILAKELSLTELLVAFKEVLEGVE